MSAPQAVAEFECEPIRGLPEVPPEGEQILWQGSPSWRGLARRALHTRAVAIYFALLVAWRVAAAFSDGAPFAAALGSGALLAGLGLAGLGILTLLAWLNARATVYTVTSRRVVVRYGVAVSLAVNFPFRAIRSVELKSYGDGTADIPMAVDGVEQLGYLMLWPHARPWAFGANAQPMLRAVPDGREVARLLARALGSSSPPKPADEAATPTVSTPPRVAAAS